ALGGGPGGLKGFPDAPPLRQGQVRVRRVPRRAPPPLPGARSTAPGLIATLSLPLTRTLRVLPLLSLSKGRWGEGRGEGSSPSERHCLVAVALATGATRAVIRSFPPRSAALAPPARPVPR